MSKRSPENKRLLAEWKAKQRKDAEAALPASREMLLALFDELDERLPVEGCDHSLRLTLAWADRVRVDAERLKHWLREYAGFCDCEVLANVQDSNPALSE